MLKGANLPVTQNKELLWPLPVPKDRWRDLSMDFVVSLPDSGGYDAIWNKACQLTKMRHLIPCHSTMTAHGLAKMFVIHIFRLRGLSSNNNIGSWYSIC